MSGSVTVKVCRPLQRYHFGGIQSLEDLGATRPCETKTKQVEFLYLQYHLSTKQCAYRGRPVCPFTPWAICSYTALNSSRLKGNLQLAAPVA